MAEKKGVRFKGHESFTLREGWLNKGLYAVAENPRVFFDNYGADALGVGPNMAKAIRYWLRCAGLIDENPKEGAMLNEAGSLILKKDPYLEDLFTLWLLHCRIAANRSQATAWNLFFNEFGYEEFEKQQLVSEMKQLAFQAANGKKVAERSIEDDCEAILHMYLKKSDKAGTPEEKNVSPFGRLELLKAGEGIYFRRQPDLRGLPEDIVFYLLAEGLRELKSVSLDELLTVKDGPGRLLQLKRTALTELLEKLEVRQKITINRTAGLNMVYMEKKPAGIQVMQEYYKKH